ncbi:MAG: hypothetical protein ACK4PR_03430 [Gammaproteobacteria bacterium]
MQQINGQKIEEKEEDIESVQGHDGNGDEWVNPHDDLSSDEDGLVPNLLINTGSGVSWGSNGSMDTIDGGDSQNGDREQSNSQGLGIDVTNVPKQLSGCEEELIEGANVAFIASIFFVALLINNAINILPAGGRPPVTTLAEIFSLENALWFLGADVGASVVFASRQFIEYLWNTRQEGRSDRELRAKLKEWGKSTVGSTILFACFSSAAGVEGIAISNEEATWWQQFIPRLETAFSGAAYLTFFEALFNKLDVAKFLHEKPGRQLIVMVVFLLTTLQYQAEITEPIMKSIKEHFQLSDDDWASLLSEVGINSVIPTLVGAGGGYVACKVVEGSANLVSWVGRKAAQVASSAYNYAANSISTQFAKQPEPIVISTGEKTPLNSNHSINADNILNI